MPNHEARLEQLGLSLPTLPPAAGKFVPAVRTGNLVFCSGQGPYRDGTYIVGRVGDTVTLEEAQEAARLCALNCLAGVHFVLGSLNAITRVVHVRGFVSSAPSFHDQPLVMNGASQLLLDIFGEAGQHARCAYGTSNLPSNIAVEVEMVVEVAG